MKPLTRLAVMYWEKRGLGHVKTLTVVTWQRFFDRADAMHAEEGGHEGATCLPTQSKRRKGLIFNAIVRGLCGCLELLGPLPGFESLWEADFKSNLLAVQN